MNRIISLLDTPAICIGRFDHPQCQPHHDATEEVANEFSINRVERGSFDIQVGRRGWTLGPGHVFLCVPGLVYRSHHQELFPVDVCLTVSYATKDIDEAGEIHLADLGRLARNCTVLPPTNRLAYLFRPIRSNPYLTKNRMAAETFATALLAEICVYNGTNRRLYAEHQFTWYAERIDAARGLLEKSYTTQHSLVSLARGVGMSTFHFARLFAELVGTPPHRYLLCVRLSEAAVRLRQGASVTDACFASGFHNLSYFIRAFGQHYGISPSKYRGRGTA